MQLNIKNAKTYELAASLSRLTGESLTQAVTKAIAERLERAEQKTRLQRKGLTRDLKRLSKKCRNLPLLDERSHGEMLYDNAGLPK